MAPYAGVIALMLPLLTAAWLAPVQFHQDLGRMAKYMDFGLYTLAFAGVFSFAFGAFLAAHTRPAASMLAMAQATASSAVCRLLKAVTWVLFGVAVAAYHLVHARIPRSIDPPRRTRRELVRAGPQDDHRDHSRRDYSGTSRDRVRHLGRPALGLHSEGLSVAAGKTGAGSHPSAYRTPHRRLGANASP
jgi:hypothetical protein